MIDRIKDIVSYICDNKEWLFSGIGVSVVCIIIGLVVNKKRNAKKQNKQSSFLNFGSNVTQTIENNTEKD